MRHLLLLVFFTVTTPLALTQDRPQSVALAQALDHLSARATALGMDEIGAADVAVTDATTSRTSGATHLYLRQKVNGIEVYNALASAHVTPAGRVVGAKVDFVPGAAQRAAAPTPMLTAAAAVEAAAQSVGLSVSDALTALEPMDDRHRSLLSTGGISREPIPVQLVYLATEDGALRLAWDLSFSPPSGLHWWSMRVDAEAGAVLERDDWTIQERLVARKSSAPRGPYVHPDGALVEARGGAAAYNVWPLPTEAPSFGDRQLVTDPADPVASPRGWHDTGSQQYTITRGNNVYAYEDRDADNTPGYSPDGGEGLAFDFPYEPTRHPVINEDVAITNLFYVANAIHDILYHYGFDEAAGNFQQTNFSGQGLGNDYVRAQAQYGWEVEDCPLTPTPNDGPCLDNAVFSTPPDGSRPLLYAYLWNGVPALTVTTPEAIAGTYENQKGGFGADFPTEPNVAQIVPVISADGGGDDAEGADRACDEIFNTDEVAGNIALIERGGCDFFIKVLNAQEAGAIAVVVHNNSRTGAGENGDPEDLISMGPGDNDPSTIVIPATFIRQSTGLLLVEHTPVEGYVLAALELDSDLDNGVMVHEYGHGVSNRLTGGPSNVGCLNQNVYDEQMGEGWSDYYGFMVTMNEGDTGEIGRGVGTYLSAEPPQGLGIRPYPYSTDLAVNPSTYGDIASANVPHGVGNIWANMLWEMTWGLIAEEGFAPDLIGGTGGNTISLRLVTEGMKVQPCGPGFVDGRDAILTADTLLYDGAYSDVIWRAFAKRGLGYSADQGSSTSVADGSEAFDLPPAVVANEDDGAGLPASYRLTAAYPNPFTERARFSLELAEAQDVSVSVYDVMGREVARLHDGPLAPGRRHEFSVDGAGLASGVYLVRLRGDHFADSRRVTLLR